MKRTKSMIYHETDESRELFLFAVNDYVSYTHAQTIIKNMARKYQKGIFNAALAVDAFYSVACTASKQYLKYFGYSFSVSDRFTTAHNLLDYFMEEITRPDAA